MGSTTRTIVLTGCFTVGAGIITALVSLTTILISNRAAERREEASRHHAMELERIKWERERGERWSRERLDTCAALLAEANTIWWERRTAPEEAERAYRRFLVIEGRIDLICSTDVRVAAQRFAGAMHRARQSPNEKEAEDGDALSRYRETAGAFVEAVKREIEG